MIHVNFRVNPLKVLMTKPGPLNCRLANWTLLLSPYDIHFIPQKVTKADFLIEHSISKNSQLHAYFPDEVMEVNEVLEGQI